MKRRLLPVSLLFVILLALSILTACADEETYLAKFETGCDSTIEAQEIVKGGRITEPVAVFRDGYRFIGWYSGEHAWDFSSDTVNENVSLTAKWQLIEYTASFYANDVLVDSLKFTIEHESLEYIPEVPEKLGYYSSWEEFSLQLSDITVNAVYTPYKFSITYDNLRNAVNPNPTDYTCEDGMIVLYAPVLNGVEFLAWLNEDGEQVTSIPAGSMGDIVLIAKWQVTYAEYLEMSPEERTAHYLSFPNASAFFEWRVAAKAKYDEEQDREIIDSDTPIELID